MTATTQTLFGWAATDLQAEERLAELSAAHLYLPLSGYDAIVLQLRLAGYADGHRMHPFDRRCIVRVRSTATAQCNALPPADVYLRLTPSEFEHLNHMLDEFAQDQPIRAFDVMLARRMATRWFCCADCHIEHQGLCAGIAPNVPAGTALALPL